jgi:hypothetical protein
LPKRLIKKVLPKRLIKKVLPKKSIAKNNEICHFPLQNSCIIRVKPLPMFKSLTIPCTRQRRPRYEPEEHCHFELLAVRQRLEGGAIDVYAYSQHNHPIMPEGTGYFGTFDIFTLKKL